MCLSLFAGLDDDDDAYVILLLKCVCVCFYGLVLCGYGETLLWLAITASGSASSLR